MQNRTTRIDQYPITTERNLRLSEAKSNNTAVFRDTVRSRGKRAHDFVLIWVDANVNASDADTKNTLTQLRQVVSDVTIMKSPEECIRYINEVYPAKCFIISSGSFGQRLVPDIHCLDHVDSIFIFCSNKSLHESWARNWEKISKVCTKIDPICKELKLIIRQCKQDDVPLSFLQCAKTITSKTDLSRLDASFMYTSLLKDTLLRMEDNQEDLPKMVDSFLEKYASEPTEVQWINKFRNEYEPKKAIWWYTKECFTYKAMNRALRFLEGGTIVDMGFFIRDLHQQLDRLHKKQFKNTNSNPFLVFRGQGFTEENFAKLQRSQGGLFAFNFFLSTSRERSIALEFAERGAKKKGQVGLLFVMRIDPKLSTTPFANIRDFSAFEEEDEILFSMHTVFKIDSIKEISGSKKIYEVSLSLTTDEDPILQKLKTFLLENYPLHSRSRLCEILMSMGDYDKAEYLYKELQKTAPSPIDTIFCYNQIALVKNSQGKYDASIQESLNSMKIAKQEFEDEHPIFIEIFLNLGDAHSSMGKYPQALNYYKESLRIAQCSCAPDDWTFLRIFNQIGILYDEMGDYSSALSYHERSLAMHQSVLPDQHPKLAIVHNNIALVHFKMNNQAKALEHYEIAMDISKKILPNDHRDLAICFHNIGGVYQLMGQLEKALSYCEISIEIFKKALPNNHPDLAICYNSLGKLYQDMSNLEKALSCFEKSLEIAQKTLAHDHPQIAVTYLNIGRMHNIMGDFKDALHYLGLSLEIRQKVFPMNHPEIAEGYDAIGILYLDTQDLRLSLDYFDKALKIRIQIHPSDHPALALSYENIGTVYLNLEDYGRALLYFQKALEIRTIKLPRNHPDLASLYNNIGLVYDTTGQFEVALQYYEKSMKIREEVLTSDHPDLGISYNNVGFVLHYFGNSTKALHYYKKAYNIFTKKLPENHSIILKIHENMGRLYKDVGDYQHADFHFRKLQSIAENMNSSPDNELQKKLKHLSFQDHRGFRYK